MEDEDDDDEVAILGFTEERIEKKCEVLMRILESEFSCERVLKRNI